MYRPRPDLVYETPPTITTIVYSRSLNGSLPEVRRQFPITRELEQLSCPTYAVFIIYVCSRNLGFHDKELTDPCPAPAPLGLSSAKAPPRARSREKSVRNKSHLHS